ncbi:MAG TPA: Wzz/FepE/Etk N-terminal domain-containing protein, partial [Stellaceae bacterium]
MSKNDIEPAGAQPIWPLAPQPGGALALPQDWAPRPAAALTPDLNLATLWRIVSEWRWLILGAVAVGLAGAIVVTFLTPPLFRASTTLEMNPPTVEVMDPSKGTRASLSTGDRDFLATQYGLLASRSLAQRVAQDLNLASNKDVVSQDLDRATRLKVATAVVAGGLEVKPVENSRLVRLNYVSRSPTLAAQITNSYADSFINSSLERRYEASAYARQFLERQIAKTRGELENSERKLVAYAQQRQIINTVSADPTGHSNDASSLEGQSLVALNAALAQAQSRRIEAETKFRNEGRVATTDVTASTAGL